MGKSFKVLKIDCKNQFSLVDLNVTKYKPVWKAMSEAIGNGCELIETVPVSQLSFNYELICDESGGLKDNEANPIASYMYGILEYGLPVMGDVLICKTVKTNEGSDFGGLDDKDIENLREWFLQELAVRFDNLKSVTL